MVPLACYTTPELKKDPGNAIFYEIIIDLSLHAQGRLIHTQCAHTHTHYFVCVCHSNPVASLSILHNDSQYIFLYINFKI